MKSWVYARVTRQTGLLVAGTAVGVGGTGVRVGVAVGGRGVGEGFAVGGTGVGEDVGVGGTGVEVGVAVGGTGVGVDVGVGGTGVGVDVAVGGTGVGVGVGSLVPHAVRNTSIAAAPTAMRVVLLNASSTGMGYVEVTPLRRLFRREAGYPEAGLFIRHALVVVDEQFHRVAIGFVVGDFDAGGILRDGVLDESE